MLTSLTSIQRVLRRDIELVYSHQMISIFYGDVLRKNLNDVRGVLAWII